MPFLYSRKTWDVINCIIYTGLACFSLNILQLFCAAELQSVGGRLKGHATDGNLHSNPILVTVASYATEGFCLLATAAAMRKFNVHVLGWQLSSEEAFVVARSKMTFLQEYFNSKETNGRNKKLYVVLDGYDVVVQGDPSKLLKSLIKIGIQKNPIVLFSGESYCAPSFSWYGIPKSCNIFYPKPKHLLCRKKVPGQIANAGFLVEDVCSKDNLELEYHYANIGMFTGTARAIKDAINIHAKCIVTVDDMKDVSDQGVFHMLMKQYHIDARVPNASSRAVVFMVDKHSTIFLNLCCPAQEKYDSNIIHLEDDEIRIGLNRSKPTFLQWPGATFDVPSYKTLKNALQKKHEKAKINVWKYVHPVGASNEQKRQWLASCMHPDERNYTL